VPVSPSPLPPPSPAPLPPVAISQHELMARVREAEERMCTSVYYLSQAARCERLALDLSERTFYSRLSPPNLPPAMPLEPSPPPPPPPPPLPDGLYVTLPTSATLSTNRVPDENPKLARGDGYYVRDRAQLDTTLANTKRDERACVKDAPLTCNTGALPENCMNSGRRCGTGDANAADPWVEFLWPHMPDRYLWAIRLVLPPNEQLSGLIVGKKELRLYGERGELVPCADGDADITGATEGEVITVLCQPGGWEEADLHALGGVHRARLTLKGTFRQLWLARIEVVERAYKSAGVGRRPPPPPVPPTPPSSSPDFVAAATASCTFVANRYIPRRNISKTQHEPCGWTDQQCCTALASSKYDMYEIDDAGCCSLHLLVDNAPGVSTFGELDFVPFDKAYDISSVGETGYWTNDAGTGYL